MATINDFIPTDDFHDVLAKWIEDLIPSTLRSEYKNVEVLSADRQLLDVDTPLQNYDCNGSNRDVFMPEGDAVENHLFFVFNGSDGGEVITVRDYDDTVTLAEVAEGEGVLLLTVGDGRYFAVGSGGGGVVETVTASNGISVNNTDPANPIVGTKGRVEFLDSGFPATNHAPLTAFAGGSTPAEQMLYWAFSNSANQYRDFKCRLVGYNGGGLTFTFLVNRTSAAAGETYIFEAAIQRIVPGTTNLTSSKTYAYNAVTVTVPAGPPNAGIPMLGTITFTHGADMDSLADGEFFILRFRRDVSDTATDVARVLAGISGVET